jgi:hypothetical protein
VVLLDHAGRDTPAVTDRDVALSCPGPDVAAALAAGRAPAGPARLRPPGGINLLLGRADATTKSRSDVELSL